VHERKIIPFPGQPSPGALELRVELVFRAYPVWRRLRIADRATFWDLHAAIQDAMGWGHRHRHLFTVDRPATGQRLRLGIPEQDAFYGRDGMEASWHFRVRDFVRPDHPPLLYTYHLGEEWQHEVQLEAIVPPPAGPLPACLAGAGACPREGFGGAEAFARLLAEPATGLPAGFDPAAFAAGEVVFCDPRLLWRDIFGGP
jgi:hypothetical protein